MPVFKLERPMYGTAFIEIEAESLDEAIAFVSSHNEEALSAWKDAQVSSDWSFNDMDEVYVCDEAGVILSIV